MRRVVEMSRWEIRKPFIIIDKRLTISRRNVELCHAKLLLKKCEQWNRPVPEVSRGVVVVTRGVSRVSSGIDIRDSSTIIRLFVIIYLFEDSSFDCFMERQLMI